MGRLIANIWRDAQAWDRPVKVGVAMGAVLLVIMLGLTLIAPQEARPMMVIGVICLVLVVQGLILWGNRHLVTPYTLAQRQFLAEDYTAARDTLLASIAETEQKGKRPTVDTLTLLGNTYRNLGLLRESEDILTTSLQRQPQNPFPLYGFGRTLLSAGRFAEAEDYFQRALKLSGAAGMAFDVALSQVWQNRLETAMPILLAVAQDTTQDATRRWMAQQLLPLEQRRITLSRDEAQEGRTFWQREANRFADTPYGQTIEQLLNRQHTGE